MEEEEDDQQQQKEEEEEKKKTRRRCTHTHFYCYIYILIKLCVLKGNAKFLLHIRRRGSEKGLHVTQCVRF